MITFLASTPMHLSLSVCSLHAVCLDGLVTYC